MTNMRDKNWRNGYMKTKINKMKYFLLFILTIIVSYTNSYPQEDKTNFVNKLNSHDGSVPEGFVPPLVSNGSLSLLIDYQGGVGAAAICKNVDSGFNTVDFRKYCSEKEIVGNIDQNKRNGTINEYLFDDLLYKCRFFVERTNA